ncbi:MAG: glycosyltransferase, partial [Halocynthiibacter sp.]
MKISVLCPTFNAGATLHETLQSVVRQDYQNFEIIIADGASTDDTLQVAQHFRPFVTTIISEPDRGQLEAIFRAAQAATGEVLFWLNADDIVMPGAFSAAIKALSAARVDYVFSDNFAFDQTGGGLFVGATIRGLSRKQHELFYRQLYSETCYFKRYLLPEPDPSFYDLRVYTDYYFFLRTLQGARGQWI